MSHCSSSENGAIAAPDALRPRQSRLHRKAWAYSELLFPNSKGEALKKQAMHDALQRLGVPDLGVRLTPELVRKAFLQLKA